MSLRDNEDVNLDQFEVLGFISKGRFGTVWKVRCILTNKIYAMKSISKEFILKHHHYLNMKREVELHSRLHHKHISIFHSYFHDNFFIYLLIDYCPNTNLYYYTKKFYPLPEVDIARFILKNQKYRYFLQIVSAVDYIHKRNIIHRDLKLENLFLDENFNVQLGDFGYAVHTLGSRSTYCGTLSYMTKEQIDKIPYGREVKLYHYIIKIDIWSLGIILFELTYKCSPFSAQSDQETIKNIKEHLLIFPDNRQVDEKLQNLIEELLESNPEKRITLKGILQHSWILKQVQQVINK